MHWCRSIMHHSLGIVGESPSLRRLLGQVETVARTGTTVLIEGETGTGKELIALALHELSPRAKGPFIKVNCAAIPGTLLESELMGHERGAFTGALARRAGRFEAAEGGTIFLDEVGDMGLDLQPKLLRVLQEREFERLGGIRPIRCDVRVIAATNRDLFDMAHQGTFREDLFYRLSVFPVTTPPLRHRREDIPLLVRHFAQQFAAALGKRIDSIDPASLELLMQHAWPGNIRELQNVVERSVILSEGAVLRVTAEFRPQAPRSSERLERPRPSETMDDVSREHILRTLESTNWVIGGPHGAAARLSMKRTTLHFRMKKLGILRQGALAG